MAWHRDSIVPAFQGWSHPAIATPSIRPEHPYLGIKLTIDTREVTHLVLDLGGKAPEVDAFPELSCALRSKR